MISRADVERYVEECYQLVLRRPADKGGLELYTNAIINKVIMAEKLPNILRNSEEFRKHSPNEYASYLASKGRYPSFGVGPAKYVVNQKTVVKHVPDLVSIIVLEFNTLEVLKPCIASILANTVHPYELIVVDNASADGSYEWEMKHEGIHTVVKNKYNYGWTKGNNVGMKVAHGDYFLLLNSDTEVLNKGWLRDMVTCAKAPKVGTVGAKLLYLDGTIQHIGGGIKNGNPYHPYDHLPENILQGRVNREVPYCTGACLLIKRSTVDVVGYLNEQFQFGYGDVDYGLSVIMAGLKNLYCHKAVLKHHWAYSQRKTRIGIRQEMLKLYQHKWINKLPEIEKRVKLTW